MLRTRRFLHEGDPIPYGCSLLVVHPTDEAPWSLIAVLWRSVGRLRALGINRHPGCLPTPFYESW